MVDYAKHKEKARQRNASASRAGRDIGEIPAPQDAKRKAKAEKDFRLFCSSYFPDIFALPWSKDHLKIISKIEQAVLRGGLFALAMPRGSGKSSLAECACLWAVLYGRRDFVALIGSDESHAADMLDSMKTELECNDLLAEDFPEVCYPIQRLDGISNRCNGQLCNGKRTHIGWTAKEIVLPTVDGSKASGAIVKVAGITGRIRGMKFKRPDGRAVRPSLVVLDDPQTDESARSQSQSATREGILAGAVLGLAGPGKKISGIMPCTVIQQGDMADNILNREKHPEWNGERTKLIYSFPTNEKLWTKYGELWAESLKAGNGGKEATDFYKTNKPAMDAGSVVAWPERFNPDELSAVQHAMNLKLQNEAAFFSEYQNEPLPQADALAVDLTADIIAAKMNGRLPGEVPQSCNYLTASIDVQKEALFYTVTAWEDNFTGYVIDYGSYPDQRTDYYQLRTIKRTLSQALQNKAGPEGTLYAGLDALTGILCGKEWIREGGSLVRIDRLLIDANWGESTDVVYQFAKQSTYSSLILPSHGRFIGPASLPFNEQHRKAGDRVGHHWKIPNVTGKRVVRHILFDSNYWKSFLYGRLATAMGDGGCLSLYGAKALKHRLIAEHLTAEYRTSTQGRGRQVDVWQLRPNKPDNHFFDCLVGCSVAASLLGCTMPGTFDAKPVKRQRVSWQQRQKEQRSKRGL
jgi:hypothetical protein